MRFTMAKLRRKGRTADAEIHSLTKIQQTITARGIVECKELRVGLGRQQDNASIRKRIDGILQIADGQEGGDGERHHLPVPAVYQN